MNVKRAACFFAAVAFGCCAPVVNGQTGEPRSSYVCIFDAAAGLEWSSGRWATAVRKSPGKFILEFARDGGRVALTLKGDGVRETCQVDRAATRPPVEATVTGHPAAQCLSGNGTAVYFAENEQRGVIARLDGAARLSSREPLLLLPFTCQRF